MSTSLSLLSLAETIGDLLQNQRLRLATAESCTGGQIAQVITAISGSSQWFERGFVTYSNEAKIELLQVKLQTLAEHGAVSKTTAQEMVEGALRHAHAEVALAVTGVAGPGGGTPEKPVGTVWFGYAKINQTTKTLCQHFSGDRITIRHQATVFALQTLIDFLNDKQCI
jgi:nicotinamide-nucleotide amidase